MKTAQKIHLIGIGGVSMCAIAQMLKSSGYAVTGSDIYAGDNVERLKTLGIPVSIGQCTENGADADIVIYTDAVAKDNPELAAAISSGKCVMDRGFALGKISECFEHGIAVSGTHGKTTTTAMLAAIFQHAEKRPTVHIGGDFHGVKGYLAGDQNYFITEACEYKRNFLKLCYESVIVTNVESDHLDYFKNMEDIRKAFEQFVSAKKGGVAVLNGNDTILRSLAKRTENAVTFGSFARCDYRAIQAESDETGRYSFVVTEHNHILGEIGLNVIGRHNVWDALAAIALARYYEIPFSVCSEALAAFRGAARRMEYAGEFQGATVISDYAHHPSEIRAVIQAVEHIKYRRIIAVFEPHTYTRLQALLPEFSAAFTGCNAVVLAEVFAAREKKIRGVHSKKLAKLIRAHGERAVCPGSYEDIAEWLKAHVRKDDVVLVLGAGKINELIPILMQNGGVSG